MYIIAILVASTTTVNAQTSSEILTKAEEYLLQINTVDYTFEFSDYDTPIRFRSSGVMVRSDYDFSVIDNNGKKRFEKLTKAFNGEIFQDRSTLSKVMLCNREPWNGTNMVCPCWTPLEYLYKWTVMIEYPLSWQSIHNPLMWNRIREKANPEISSVLVGNSSIKCSKVVILNPSGTSSHIYFAIEKNYVPVKMEIVSADNKILEKTDVVDLISVKSGDNDKVIWFPSVVSASQIAFEDNNYEGFEISYRVLPESLNLNKGIDAGVFTLNYDGMVNVILNDKEVYLPEADKVISIEEPPNLLISNKTIDGRGLGTVSMVVVFANVILIAALILVFLRVKKS